ncbi:hypothetical protein [Leptospira kmetyi]|uniref:Transposase n=1 Tax=Leptospira kmetyi TaxID=408139 RepID=A0ABX4N4S7_9LEPT|nr:hypothetical protein [Leptospira kmetyi]PJZ28301.1 hypothetical protein CH378_18430 [Leptospira kmetyi]
MENYKALSKIKKEYPPYWVSSVCKSLRTRHRTIDKRINSKFYSKQRTWKICVEYNAQKLRRLHAKDGGQRKENNKPWKAYVIYQKEKLSRKFDENSLWKRFENRMLKKIINHNFPKERDTLWHWFFQVQRRKLEIIHPTLNDRPKDYRNRFASRQIEKLNFLYTKKRPENIEWRFWWLAQQRKLHNRYRGILGVKNRRKIETNPSW